MGRMARSGLGKKIGLGAAAVAGIVVVVLFATPFGKGIRDIWRSGAVQSMVTKPPKRTYDASNSDENLKALSIALRLYQDSEGQYPDADKWMDQVAPRLILNDLPKKEADKKLVRPDVGEGEFGYAINDAAAGKYKGDLKKGTILLFESAATTRNAHGDPKKDGRPGGRALTIDGDLVGL